MKNIGESIRSYRKAAKLTQSQLACASNTSLMSIRRYESNERIPDIVQLQKIAEALKIPLVELLGIKYEENYLDTNDVYKFFDSLGYILQNVSEDKFNLISKDISNPIRLTLTWEELKNIKFDTWKYLKFSLNEYNNKNNV